LTRSTPRPRAQALAFAGYASGAVGLALRLARQNQDSAQALISGSAQPSQLLSLRAHLPPVAEPARGTNEQVTGP
jgi:hypothetical protein